LKTDLTRNAIAHRHSKGLLASLIALLTLFGAQMIVASPAGAIIAQCSERVCTDDPGSGGPANGGDLDSCYVNPGADCWGTTDSGSQSQGSMGSEGSSGSGGVDPEDWCASYGVACGTPQSGNGNASDPFANLRTPDPNLLGSPDVSSSTTLDQPKRPWNSLGINCASLREGNPPMSAEELDDTCKGLKSLVPSRDGCYSLRSALEENTSPRQSVEHHLMAAESALCNATQDFMDISALCRMGRHSYSSDERARCETASYQALDSMADWMIRRNRLRKQFKQQHDRSH
jgi:hypothetical protein